MVASLLKTLVLPPYCPTFPNMTIVRRQASVRDDVGMNLFFMAGAMPVICCIKRLPPACNCVETAMVKNTSREELNVHDRSCWKACCATMSSGLPVACNMCARPCQARFARQARRKWHQVMIRSFATCARTIVVLSIGTLGPRGAFRHMACSSTSVRDFVGNRWVVAHTNRLMSSVGLEIAHYGIHGFMDPWNSLCHLLALK